MMKKVVLIAATLFVSSGPKICLAGPLWSSGKYLTPAFEGAVRLLTEHGSPAASNFRRMNSDSARSWLDKTATPLSADDAGPRYPPGIPMWDFASGHDHLPLSAASALAISITTVCPGVSPVGRLE